MVLVREYSVSKYESVRYQWGKVPIAVAFYISPYCRTKGLGIRAFVVSIHEINGFIANGDTNLITSM